MTIIIANILSLISCILLAISCKKKTQEDVMKYQCIECLFSAASALLLGGITGAIVTLVALVRNLVSLAGKSNIKLSLILASISLALSVFKANSLIDMLPALASAEYTLAISKDNVKITKIAFMINNLMWLIYSVTIYNWVKVIFSTVIITVCIIELKKIKCTST